MKITRAIHRAEQQKYLKGVKLEMKKRKQKKKVKGMDELEDEMNKLGKRPRSALRRGSSEDLISQGRRSKRRGSSEDLVMQGRSSTRKSSSSTQKRHRKDSGSSESSDSSSDESSSSSSEDDHNRTRKTRKANKKGKKKSKGKKELVFKVPLYETCTFVCKKWLAKDEGDGLYERELEAKNKEIFYKET